MKQFQSDRRTLLTGALAAGVIPAAVTPKDAAATTPLQPVDDRLDVGERPWLGRAFWANRPQDWRRSGDWLECLRGEAGMEVRSVGILTRSLGTSGAATIEVIAAAEGQGGFGGFLIGVGGGRLHPLAAAMAQRGSGKGGGILAVVDPAGRPMFREHTSDDSPLAFKELSATARMSAPIDLSRTPVRLRLSIEPAGRGMSVLTLSVRSDAASGPENVAQIVGVPNELLAGGLSLISSPPTGTAGARFRFRALRVGGERIEVHEERSIGPCVAALYSLANDTLKVAAHFQHFGDRDATVAFLERRLSGKGRWSRVGTATIGLGNVAAFRVPDWDGRSRWDYRVLYAPQGAAKTVFQGSVAPDPVHSRRSMSIAMYGCISSVQYPLEATPTAPSLRESTRFGRYEPENFSFPHPEIVNHGLSLAPDLVFVSGDQYYEGNPTRGTLGKPDAVEDTIYRFHQWLVSFRDLIRDRPTIVLVDDHDVLQGNLWGDGGRAAPSGEQNRGGFASPEIARLAYAMQCAANPDPEDPTPIGVDIPVSYCAFLYGGTSFAIIEDRKWKTTPMEGEDLDIHVPELLGPRQEAFLAKWKTMHPGAPKVMLTQSLWGTLQTDPEGRALVDFDSNGYPPLPRRRAVQLAADTRCIMLAGDQHLPSLVRLGTKAFADGPLQFAGPAGSTAWQRWFEAFGKLANRRDDDPNTGDFEDAFGNRMRVLAVANPKLSFAAFRDQRKGRAQGVQDRALKSEGFGMVRLDHAQRTVTFECWPWDVDPGQADARQFHGWPYVVKYDQL